MKNERKKKFNLGDILRRINETSGSNSIEEKEDIPDHQNLQKKNSLDNAQENKSISSNDSLPSQPSFKAEKPNHLSRPSDNNITSATIEGDSKSSLGHKQVPSSELPSNFGSSSDIPREKLGFHKINQTKENEDEEIFDLFRYLEVIIRRKEIIIVSVLIMGIFSIFSFLRSPKYYTAEARLLFRPDRELILNNGISWRYFVDREKNFNTHLELLKSNTVLERIVNKLGYKINAGTIANNLTIVQGKTDDEPNNIIELSFKNANSEIACNVLNELCKTYIEYRREVNAQEDSRLVFKLKTQIDKIQNNLSNKEDALRVFKESHQMVQLSNDANLVMTKLANMEISLQETQMGLLEGKERLTTLKKQIGQQEINIVQSMTYENPYRNKLSQLELELNTLSAEYSPDHYKIKMINSQIDKLKQALKNEITKEASKQTFVKNPIRQSLLQDFINQNIEISALETKRNAQEQIIEKLNMEMGKLPSLEQEYAFLQRETESLVQTLKMLKMKYEEAKIRRDSKESELKILELAKKPSIAISSKKISSIFIGIFIGLIIGIALVFLLEYLDQSLKDPADVEKKLELPLIGIVPLIETDKPVINVETLTKNMLEPFRLLRANIKHIISQHNVKTFMICSAVKGEGKTTLAINLAIAFAMDRKKVILLDCDLRRSQIHTFLNISKKNGITEYLTGKLTLNNIIKPTIYKNLFVITSGERATNPSELLGLPLFEKMIQELKPQADVIILDSPALIAVSDTMTMAPYIDRCIMVIRSLWTPLKAAKQAISQLTRIGINLTGGVLNGIARSRGYYPYYYGYYSYHKYMYDYDYDEESKKKFTIRQFGLDIEKKIKTSFQNFSFTFPRYLTNIYNFLKNIIRRLRFWTLLILLTIVVALRYFFVSQKQSTDSDIITYLGNGKTEKTYQKNPNNDHQLNEDIGNIPNANNSLSKKKSLSETLLTKGSDFIAKENVSRWIESYNSYDTTNFFQLYDSLYFKYPGGGLKEWREKKRSELLQKSNKEVIITIMNSISVEKLKKEHYKTSFQAVFSGDKNTTYIITMIWKNRNNRWRIIREKSSRVK